MNKLKEEIIEDYGNWVTTALGYLGDSIGVKNIAVENFKLKLDNLMENKLEANIYKMVTDCVQNGIAGGWNKAMKRIDGRMDSDRAEDVIKEQIEHYIMLEFSENFKFD